MEIINKGRPVYISFSEKDKGKVDKLVSALQNAGIEFSYMYHNLPGAEKIAYEREIGFGEFVILVFGKDYFESWDCMYEFARVNKFKELNNQKMVICLPFEGYKDIMNSDNGWQPIKDKWDHRKSEGEEDNGVKSLAKFYNYYGKEILRLPDYYKNIVRPERKDEDYQKLITQVKDFYENNPTPITNSSEIFYKFDKDMWKNLVLKGKINGDDQYFIPDIREGLDAEDQVLFDEMINELQSGDNPVLYKVDKPDSDERTSSYPNPLILKSKKYSFTLTPRPHEHFCFTYYLVQRDFVDEFEATNELDNYHDAYYNVFTKIYGRQAKIEG